jgi:hypothetical protein
MQATGSSYSCFEAAHPYTVNTANNAASSQRVVVLVEFPDDSRQGAFTRSTESHLDRIHQGFAAALAIWIADAPENKMLTLH